MLSLYSQIPFYNELTITCYTSLYFNLSVILQLLHINSIHTMKQDCAVH